MNLELAADEIPDDYVLSELDLPDEVKTESIEADALPANWWQIDGRAVCQPLGREWLESGRTVACFVPSSVVPMERNILLNPAHGDMRRVSIMGTTPFNFDDRLFKSTA